MHSRQASTKQPTPTASPTLKLVTKDPTYLTIPANSCPGTIGYLVFPKSFSAKWRSEWQIPQYKTSKATSFSPTGLL